MTVVLRIERSVADFDRWRRAFGSDPVGCEQSAVQRHRMMHAGGDPSYALVDLEFHAPEAGEGFVAQLRQLCGRVDLIRDATARIVALVRERELSVHPERT
jgi:hypothetical protein